MPTGGSQHTTTSTVAQPWEGVQPFLTGAYGTAQNIYQGGPPSYYPGQTLAPHSPYTQAAIGLQAERGLYGSPMVGAAQEGIGNIVGGSVSSRFAPNADLSNATLQGLLSNPNTAAFNGLASAAQSPLWGLANGSGNPLGLLSGTTDAALARSMNPMAGVVSAGLLGQGRDLLGNYIAGAGNPVSASQAADAASGIAALGQNGQILSPGIAGQAGGALSSLLQSGNPFGGQSGQIGSSLTRLMNSSAAAPLLGNASDALGGFAGGRDLAAANQPRQAADDAITSSLRGDWLQSGNPYFSNAVESATRPLVDNFQKNIAPAIASQFSAAGRYGSGAQADALTQAASDLDRSVGDVSSNLAFQNWNQERQNMLANTGLALQDYGNAAQRQLGAAGQIADLYNQDRAAQQAATALAGNLYQGGTGQTLGAVGQALNALGQQSAQQLAAQQGLLGNWYQGTGQQLGSLSNLMQQFAGQQGLALNAAQAATQGNLGYGNQQLGALQQIFGNALNSNGQALAAAGQGAQNFLNAEGDQIRGAQLVPQLAQQDYLDLNQLGAAGSMQDAWNQAAINADIDRWNYNANAPLNWTGNYIGLLNSAPWSSSTTARVPGPSGFQSALQTGGQIMQMLGPLLMAL